MRVIAGIILAVLLCGCVLGTEADKSYEMKLSEDDAIGAPPSTFETPPTTTIIEKTKETTSTIASVVTSASASTASIPVTATTEAATETSGIPATSTTTPSKATEPSSTNESSEAATESRKACYSDSDCRSCARVCYSSISEAIPACEGGLARDCQCLVGRCVLKTTTTTSTTTTTTKTTTTTTSTTTTTTSTTSTTVFKCSVECYDIKKPGVKECAAGCCISRDTHCVYQTSFYGGQACRCK